MIIFSEKGFSISIESEFPKTDYLNYKKSIVGIIKDHSTGQYPSGSDVFYLMDLLQKMQLSEDQIN